MSARRAELRRAQRGVALITVLLIVAIMTALVSRMSLSAMIWRRQVENGTALSQAIQGTRAAQIWVGNLIAADRNEYDAPDEDWAQPLPPIPVAWGFLTGWMEDMQGRFNLNNLVDSEGQAAGMAVQQFVELLKALELPPGIAEAAVDWIDPDGATAGVWGAEDIYYLGLDRPYHAANRPFDDARELRLVRGVDREAWLKLEPFVSALPGRTPLNVNTASPEVLTAVLAAWNVAPAAQAKVRSWLADPDREPARDIGAFAGEVLGTAQTPALASLSVNTSYFTVHSRLGLDNVEYRMATLYQRHEGRATVVRQAREIY